MAISDVGPDKNSLITGKTSAAGIFSFFMAKRVSADTVLDRKQQKTFGPDVLADQEDFVRLLALCNLQKIVWEFYTRNARVMPWRTADNGGGFDPYHILVSELMLQQTQVSRVMPKYDQFIRQFPTINRLADSPLGDVLVAWQGLGYNRRAKYLHAAAQMVRDNYGGVLPDDEASLVALPGIGGNTAGAILAYSYNKPVVFVETNVRTVLIHHLYPQGGKVADKDLLLIMRRLVSLLDTSYYQPTHGLHREWYWALMDYGSFLKKQVGNASRQSKHYVKQSAFHGSVRQIRGAVLRELSAQPQPLEYLASTLDDQRLPSVLRALESEGLIRIGADDMYRIG